MEDPSSLKKEVVNYMNRVEILKKFYEIATIHSQKYLVGTEFAFEPLILDFEIDLRLLFVSSPNLFDKVTEFPLEGRRLFQEVIAEALKEYLAKKKMGICCVQLLLRCTFFPKIVQGNSLVSKTFGYLSYFNNYILTNVTVPRCTTICVLYHCLDISCPGHAGKYISMEALAEPDTINKCDYCHKKTVENAAGRGQVRRVIAKFVSIQALKFYGKIALCRSLTCSITDPLSKELKLGDMYTIWGHYNVSTYEVWGLNRSSFFSLPNEISLSSWPRSINHLLQQQTELNCPWSFVRKLAMHLGSNTYPKKTSMSLKMGLLLSLATLGSDRCASILCVGKIDISEEDIMDYSGNCADRCIPVKFPVRGNITKNGEDTWLNSGSLLLAKTGICYVGNWKSLKPAQSDELLSVLDDEYISLGSKDTKSTGNDNNDSLSPPMPLKTAVWTYWNHSKRCSQQELNILKNLIEVFGIPFIAGTDELSVDYVLESLELALKADKVNSCTEENCEDTVPINDMMEFLRIVNGIEVTLSEEAVTLMKDYFVACRHVRGDVFPARSITFMTTMSEAHAKLCLRSEVTYDDVTTIIYLYEETMCFLYGNPISVKPPFMKQNDYNVSKDMGAFKMWLKQYLTTLVH